MSRVVVVKQEENGSKATADDYRVMLQTGLAALAFTDSAAEAVRKLLPSGTVGMKTNCLARRNNSTPVALVEAFADLLNEAGHRDDQIVVWERTSRELEAAGFKLNASNGSRRCLGTDANGVGYSQRLYSFGKVDSLVSHILTDMVDCNVNMPVLKDHSIAGLSGGLKNMYGAIHNPNKFHADNCDPFCAHVNNLTPIKLKNLLTITDAVRVQYDGGPGFMEQYVAWYGGLIISDDPVAADRVGLEIITRLRSNHGRPPLEAVGREVRYLKTAESIGLGVAEWARIDLAVLAPGEDVESARQGLF